MTTLYTVPDPALRRVVRDGEIFDRPGRVHKRYMTVSPDLLVESLRDTAFEVDVRPSRGKWRDIVIVRRPGIDVSGKGTEAFKTGVSILLDHSGRHSIHFVPFALRLICDNQFSMPFWSFEHTSPECQQFVMNPRERLQELLDRALEIPARLGHLRESTVPHLFQDLRSIIEESGRKRLIRSWDRQEGQYPYTTWGALQSLTATKRPTFVRLASDLLFGQWELTRKDSLDCAFVEEYLKPKAKKAKETKCAE